MNARWLNGRPHPLNCACGACSEYEQLSALKLTHDAPTAALDARSVSTLEVLQDWQLRELRKTLDYAVGEDWNDD